MKLKERQFEQDTLSKAYKSWDKRAGLKKHQGGARVVSGLEESANET